MATLATGKLSEIFEEFLKTVTDRNGEHVYRSRISQLIASEGKSLVVDFSDLLRYNDDLANKVLLEPDTSLDAFRKAAYETMRSENALYADRIRRQLKVRIRGIPDQVPLRRVDTSYLDRMLAVAGMVVRTSELRPLMIEGAFICPSGHVTYQEQDDMMLKKPPRCELCGETRNFELDRKGSRFIDFQIIRIQELPEELPPGQLPQFFDVNVEGDIVNTARPGDRVVLTGIVRAVPDYSPGQVRMRLFRSQIDCNYIEVRGKEPEQVQVTKEDEAIIRSIASSPDAYEKLINSIAPAIMGHAAEKEAILLLLAGGTSTSLPDGTKLRGDINVLFVGDPGVAKSEMLKFAAQVAPRGMFTSGRGTTAAGLSAAVIREKNVLMLEAGVVVLADQGIACLHPGSRIVYDNRIVTVGELAEQVRFVKIVSREGVEEVGLVSGQLPSLDEADYRVKPNRAKMIRRRHHSGKLKSVALRSGNRLLLTEEHLLLDGKRLEWRKAGSFAAGDFVVAPLRIPAPEHCEAYLWDVLPGSCLVSLTEDQSSELVTLLEGRYGTLPHAFSEAGTCISALPGGRLQLTLSELKRVARLLGVEDEWKRKHYTYDGCGVHTATLTPELAYLCGYVLGECWAGGTSVGALAMGRGREERFREYWELTFGGDWREGGAQNLFDHVYRHVAGKSLAEILALPDGALRGLIAGLTDSAACSVLKGGGAGGETGLAYRVGPGDTAGLNLLLALRRLCVVGSYRGGGVVEVRSASDVARLALEIGDRSAKAGAAVRLHEPGAQAALVRTDGGSSSFVQGAGILVSVGRSGSAWSVPGRDYFLDEVVAVEEIPYTGYVYDMVMEGAPNFVAEGTIVHNCIDEFDKMRPEDRSALHEQMEQQSVTVAKGGIYAALNARTAILAATNPILGKYNPFQNLTDNISLPIPLLSRFDLIFVIKDQPAPAEDEKLASHILAVHAKRGYNTPPPVEFSLLKKYIAYAKKIQPNLTKEAMDRIREFYLDLRRRGQEGQITATPRTLESLIRLATARARILLKEEVTEEDALAAISLMNKMVEDVLTDATTKTKADFGVLLGRPAGERKNLATAIEIFKSLEGAEKKPVERRVFKEELIKAKFTEEDADKMIKTMFREGLIYETKPGFFRRVGS